METNNTIHGSVSVKVPRWLSKGIQCSAIAFLPCWGSGRKLLDTKNVFGALLADLSKAFDVLPHDLIIAKLNAFMDLAFLH